MYKTTIVKGPLPLLSFTCLHVYIAPLQLLTLLFCRFLCRYDNEKGRYRANKKASMLSLLEDGYLDAEDEEDTVRTHYAFFIVAATKLYVNFTTYIQ